MAKFQEGKEKTIDDVIKELGLEEVHYDGDDFDEDPDKDFKDPYEETYNRLKKNINKRNEQKDRDSLRAAARRENANREVMRDIDRAARKKSAEAKPKHDKYVYEPISKKKDTATESGYKGLIDDEFDDERNESFRIDLDIDAVNDIYEESKMKKEGRKSGAILNKILAFGGIAVAVLFVIFILGATGVVGSKEAETEAVIEEATTKTNINVNIKDSVDDDTFDEDNSLINSNNSDSDSSKGSSSNSSDSDDDVRVIKIN
ncbi:MAG: hypothetical protein E7242_06035 [Lachnospiraceae bacterium]|nr:hypothetical protein [Lachnospiraceae bacterium]